MPHIDPDAETLTVLSVFDLPEGRTRAVLDRALGHTESHVRHLPGFLSSTWHLRTAAGPGGDRDPRTPERQGIRRVAEYSRWADRRAFEAFLAEPENVRHHDDVRVHQPRARWQPYTVSTVVGAADLAGGSGVTVIVSATVHPGHRRWVEEYNVRETHRLIKYLPGFVGAAFHRGGDDRTAEYVRWESAGHLYDAYRRDDFREHIAVNGRYARSDWAVYQIEACFESGDAVVGPTSH